MQKKKLHLLTLCLALVLTLQMSSTVWAASSHLAKKATYHWRVKPVVIFQTSAPKSFTDYASLLNG